MVTPPLGLDLHSVKVIVEEEKSLLTLTTQPQKNCILDKAVLCFPESPLAFSVISRY